MTTPADKEALKTLRQELQAIKRQKRAALRVSLQEVAAPFRQELADLREQTQLVQQKRATVYQRWKHAKSSIDRDEILRRPVNRLGLPELTALAQRVLGSSTGCPGSVAPVGTPAESPGRAPTS